MKTTPENYPGQLRRFRETLDAVKRDPGPSGDERSRILALDLELFKAEQLVRIAGYLHGIEAIMSPQLARDGQMLSGSKWVSQTAAEVLAEGPENVRRLADEVENSDDRGDS